jgi:hypothetical protein
VTSLQHGALPLTRLYRHRGDAENVSMS